MQLWERHKVTTSWWQSGNWDPGSDSFYSGMCPLSTLGALKFCARPVLGTWYSIGLGKERIKPDVLWKKKNQSELGGRGEGERVQNKRCWELLVCRLPDGRSDSQANAQPQEAAKYPGFHSINHRAAVLLGPLGRGATAWNWLLSKQMGYKSVFL